MNENLWPDFEPKKIVSPKALMIEQANYLSESTKNVVLGEVSTNPAGKQDQVMHVFTIVAPALNNYKFDLFSIQHEIIFYPLSLYVKNTLFKIQNEEEFKEKMKEIFNAEETKKVIMSLHSQSVA